jgi:hypothetical protein
MRPIWRVLLGLYFLIVGAIAVLSLTFSGLPVIMGVLAIVIGILILIDR